MVAYSSTNTKISFFYVYIRFYHGLGYAGDFFGYMIMRCLFYATRMSRTSQAARRSTCSTKIIIIITIININK
jgi:hypothetical protein